MFSHEYNHHYHQEESMSIISKSEVEEQMAEDLAGKANPYSVLFTLFDIKLSKTYIPTHTLLEHVH